jgi:hypothetical protein
MPVLHTVLLAIAMTLHVIMGIYAVNRSRSDGAVAFFSLMMFSFVWSGATLMESHMTHFQSMVLWRNIQQLGVFGAPLIILFFAITHTKRYKLLPYAYAAMVIQTLVFFVVVTDNIHHLVRESVSVVTSPVYGKTLVVVLSPFGDICVLLTILVALSAILVLSFRNVEASDKEWRQIRTIRSGLLMVMFNASVRQDILS